MSEMDVRRHVNIRIYIHQDTDGVCGFRIVKNSYTNEDGYGMRTLPDVALTRTGWKEVETGSDHPMPPELTESDLRYVAAILQSTLYESVTFVKGDGL